MKTRNAVSVGHSARILCDALLFVLTLAFAPASLRAQLVADGGTLNLTTATNLAGDLIVGTNAGKTTLNIIAPGTVTNSNGYISYDVGSVSNKVTVQNVGAVWKNRGELYLGYRGASGALIISDGATVMNNPADIAYDPPSSNNIALVTGAGSLWTNSSDLWLGDYGSDNQLVVSDGATVACHNGSIGAWSPSSNNTALVTGANSLWTNRVDLFLGSLSSTGIRLIVSSGGTVGGTGTYPSNSICAVVASANPGWGFQKWTENGVQVSTAANYTFTLRTNRTLVANFVPAFVVTTSVSPAYGGAAAGDGTFNSNSVVLVTATPNTGFTFVNWTEFGTPVSTSVNYSFNLTADRILVANFAPASVSATFDFDTGAPAVGPGQGMPATQTKNGVTATFSTLAGGWSVQNTFYSWVPSVFSGNFLYPSTWGSTMAVEFNQPITNFTMAFFTGELSSEYDTAGLVSVTA